MSDCHIFGPVTSSRLGRSLGLDPLDEKRCTFDCLYCEVGPQPERVVERGVFVPTEVLLRELRNWREGHTSKPDFVTLSGSGEPCLHSDLERLIQEPRKIVPDTPIAVLTNSSLLPDPTVRAELAKADVVLPSIDTLVEREFKILDRPHESLKLEAIAKGLLDFRNEFQGRIYLEVFLSQGINDSEQNLALLEEYVRELRPERVDVVTLSRPGAYEKGKTASEESLERFARTLTDAIGGKGGKAEAKAESGVNQGAGIALRHALGQEGGVCASSPESPAPSAALQVLAEEVYQSLRRRPQTAAQLATALDSAQPDVAAALEELLDKKRVRALPDAEPPFFKAV